MNISVYLPETLKHRLDEYLKKEDTTQNAAIRKAIELLLERDATKRWGSWIDDLEPDPDFPTIQELRSDLKPPNEDLF